jgi:galactoside O-acetyltransferase
MGNSREYLHSGELYYPGDPELLKEQNSYQDMVYEYNNLRPTEGEKRTELLKKMLAECGDDTYIEAPFHANFGGHHCHLGKKIYINFNLTCVDDTHIYIGDYTMIGPNVTLATAGHPTDPELRKKGLQFNKPIHIGKNCWLGSGVLVMPGVTIGDNTVIGAGSVVTKDIPSNVVAFGNPCRVYREVGEK